ncbi:hypothetical protein U9M48_001046 [Paspalum notatum var. saurae]|uniref:Cytochrome P450 n=1 Tax=Paspalum notatum var. saurae TaxID=547442 RepID=A0AAQ3PNL6_PASNO
MPAMDAATKGDALVLLVVGVVTVFTLVVLAAVRSRRGRGGAPSPRSVPLLGHLHLLGKPLHRSLAALAAAHGGGGGSLAPLLSLRLGARRALLVSTHDAAAECFTARDAALAGRPRLLAGDILGYGFTDILWAPYGDHWRGIRKFFTAELLSTSRLAARATDRRAEVAALVENLRRDSDGSAVALRPRLFEFVINVMLRALIGACVDARDARRFQEIIEETVRLIGTPCVGDLYPSLRWVDRLRGVDAALTRMQARRDALLVGLIDDHRRKRDRDAGVPDAGHEGAAIDELLSLQELDPKQYSDAIVKGIVMAILQGGTDTSSLTMEWAMALLLQHPEAMAKARSEIDVHVGTSRLVEESDIANLPYLQCVVKETLRLCPVGPIIPAHEAMEDCTVGGFHVQRGTMILVNAWAIQRDPKVWDAPEEFRPQRFLDGGGVVNVAAVPMLPFGIGRRRCPAENLAMRLVSVTVAALVQCFEWGVGDGAGVDMAEGGGLSMPMATPLAAVCRPREFVQTMLSASA